MQAAAAALTLFFDPPRLPTCTLRPSPSSSRLVAPARLGVSTLAPVHGKP